MLNREGFVQQRCPKCGGGVHIGKDYDSWYEKCSECGYTCDLPIVCKVEVKERICKA